MVMLYDWSIGHPNKSNVFKILVSKHVSQGYKYNSIIARYSVSVAVYIKQCIFNHSNSSQAQASSTPTAGVLPSKVATLSKSQSDHLYSTSYLQIYLPNNWKLTGLSNLRNTCYLNSVLQCILNFELLHFFNLLSMVDQTWSSIIISHLSKEIWHCILKISQLEIFLFCHNSL